MAHDAHTGIQVLQNFVVILIVSINRTFLQAAVYQMLHLAVEIIGKLSEIIAMIIRVNAVFEKDRVTMDTGRGEMVCNLLLLQCLHHVSQALVHCILHLSVDVSFTTVEESAERQSQLFKLS